MNDVAWISIGVLVSLGATLLFFWFPQAMKQRIRRTGGVVGSDEPERPTSELLSPPLSQALRQKDAHDELLREALKFLNLARSRDVQSLQTLNDADQRAAEALLLRPDGFDATRLRAEISIARAGLVGADEQATAYQEAAQRFETALALRKGVIDLYVGLGWSWLGVARADAAQDDALVNALGAFTAGHETSRGNLWIIKGWGSAVDVMQRQGHPSADAGLSQYEAVLGGLVGPVASAGEWFAEIRANPEPTWLPVPLLRDV